MSWLKFGLLLVTSICITLDTTNVMAQEWADLRITFVYDGEAPEPQPINVGKDPFCEANGNRVYTENMLVQWTNGGIRNIVFSLDIKDVSKLRIHPDLAKVPADKALLE